MMQDVGKRRRGGLHLKRYGEILTVLARYGFGDFLSNINIEKYVLFPARLKNRRVDPSATGKTTRWERLRRALEDLGPTFVKLGQFASNRPDILPPDCIIELVKLQDSARPFPVDEARQIVEREWKRPIKDTVAEFSDEPIASASIAQVHKARLLTGEEVAVKIQRPRIMQTIATDIDILYHLAHLAERYLEYARVFRATQLVEEFERIISKEMDFTVEASHFSTFRRNFENVPGISFPSVFPELTTNKVLVTELVHGTKVSEIEILREKGIDTHAIAVAGADVVLKQIFEHGFFHADPHPGNIIIRDDGTICFLDCGAVGIIPFTLRHQIGMILFGVVSKDPERIVQTLKRMSHRPINDPESLEYDIAEFIEEHASLSLKEIHVGEVLDRFAKIVIRHNLEIIPGFYLLLKSIVTYEGVAYRLDPSFAMVEHIEPHVRKLIRMNPRWKYIPYDFYFTLQEMTSLVKDLPFEIRDVLKLVKGGETRIQFEHRGLEPLMVTGDQLVNRLVFAIVVASLIIGSSIVVHADIPPKIYGISIIGLAGFLIAGIIGFGLIFSILRHRRM